MKLFTPRGGVRPTLSVARESVFSILAAYFDRTGSDFTDLKFLDCFSGSGIMALEACSRGFEVVAIEKNRENANIIKENFKKTGVSAQVIIADALRFKTNENFDVVYLDPPWETDYSKIIRAVGAIGKVIVCEHDKALPEHNLEILKEKKYGRTRLTFLTAAADK